MPDAVTVPPVGTESPAKPPNSAWYVKALVMGAIGAAAGAVFGSNSRPEFSMEQFAPLNLLGFLGQWAVTGAVIGLSQQWFFHQFRSYGRAALVWAVNMVILLAVVEAILIAISLQTGGWQGGLQSAAIGAIVGVLAIPLFIGLFWLVGKFYELIARLFGKGNTAE